MARKTPPIEQPDEPKPLKPPSAQQMKFIDAYMLHFNGYKAAVEAGYAENSARVQASRLLTQDNIKAELERRYKANAMSAAEILQHLTEIARGDIDDVVDDKGNLDLEKARKEGKTRLLKKLKARAITTENSDIVETETELYGRLEALKLLGQFHALFVDRAEVTVRDWRLQAIEDIKAGTLTYSALAQLFDSDLASELFQQAGVPIES